MLNQYLECRNGCNAGVLLPALAVKLDCPNYDQRDSQICDLIIIPHCADDVFDWSGGACPEFLPSGIDNTVTDNSKAKRVVGEGGIDVPEKAVENFPRNVQFISLRRYRLEFRVKNMSDGHIEMLRKLQCGWTGFTFYYLTVGGRLHGGQGGFLPAFVDADMPLGAERGDKEYGDIIIEWETDIFPPVCDVSISDADFEEPVSEPSTAEGWGDPSTGEVWGDPDTGEIFGYPIP